MEDTFCLRTHFVVRIAATAFIYYHIIFDVSIYIFYGFCRCLAQSTLYILTRTLLSVNILFCLFVAS